MAADESKGEDNPFLRGLREEWELELEEDRISWKRALLIRKKYDAQADGDSALAAELGVRIAELRRRRRALYG